MRSISLKTIEINNFSNFEYIKEYFLIDEPDSSVEAKNIFINNYLNHIKCNSYKEYEYYYIIDDNYFLIKANKSKKDELFKQILQRKEEFKEAIQSNPKNGDEFIKKLMNFMNFVYIPNAECITIINLKKLLLIRLFDYSLYDYILMSEYLYIHLINISNRKCSLSWGYKEYLRDFILNMIKKSSYNDQIYNSIMNLYKNKYNIINLNSFIDKSFLSIENINEYLLLEKDNERLYGFIFILVEIQLAYEVNIKEKRNYFLWKYLNFYIKDSQSYNNSEKLIIINNNQIRLSFIRVFLLFSFYISLFLKDIKDYSLFHLIKSFLLLNAYKEKYESEIIILYRISYDLLSNMKFKLESNCYVSSNEDFVYIQNLIDHLKNNIDEV